MLRILMALALVLFPVWQVKEGCGMDPDGLSLPDLSDEGCGMDPNGRCLPGS